VTVGLVTTIAILASTVLSTAIYTVYVTMQVRVGGHYAVPCGTIQCMLLLSAASDAPALRWGSLRR
jgi:hypothetical protein